jgi:hypothetical protein
MKRNFNYRIAGVAVACMLSGLLTGCLIDMGKTGVIACQDNSDCGSNEICGESGFCTTDTPPPVTCEAHHECENGQRCNTQGLCENADLCMSDSECDAHFRCNTEDVCLSGPGQPSLAVCYGFCEADDTPSECFDDSECAANEYCDVASQAPPASGNKFGGAPAVQPAGVCRPEPARWCSTHDECASGQFCGWGEEPVGGASDSEGASADMMEAPSGICMDLPPQGCVRDADCDGAATCSQESHWGPSEPGKCIVESTPCWSDQDCGEGAYCRPGPVPALPDSGDGADEVPAMEAPMGTCVDLKSGECFSDDDCGKDAVCEHPNPDMGPGMCADVPTTCGTDADCDPNEECSYNHLGMGAEAAPTTDVAGICLPKEPVYCSSDWECGDGETCEFDQDNWANNDAFGCQEHNEAMVAPMGQCMPEVEEAQ